MSLHQECLVVKLLTISNLASHCHEILSNCKRVMGSEESEE